MNVEPIEVFDATTNAAVVRMPGRQFPGIVIQEDSPRILTDLAKSILEKTAKSADEELIDEAEELVS